MRNLVEEVRDVRANEHCDQAAARDVIREDDTVCARTQQLRFGLLDIRPCDDGQVGPQAARGENDEDVLGVGLGGGNEAARARAMPASLNLLSCAASPWTAS